MAVALLRASHSRAYCTIRAHALTRMVQVQSLVVEVFIRASSIVGLSFVMSYFLDLLAIVIGLSQYDNIAGVLSCAFFKCFLMMELVYLCCWVMICQSCESTAMCLLGF